MFQVFDFRVVHTSCSGIFPDFHTFPGHRSVVSLGRSQHRRATAAGVWNRKHSGQGRWSGHRLVLGRDGFLASFRCQKVVLKRLTIMLLFVFFLFELIWHEFDIPSIDVHIHIICFN